MWGPGDCSLIHHPQWGLKFSALPDNLTAVSTILKCFQYVIDYIKNMILPENMFLRFSTAAASWLCCTTASLTSLRFSMVLMLCLQSLLTSIKDCWISFTSFSALCSWLRPVRTPSNCDWIAALNTKRTTKKELVLIIISSVFSTCLKN